MNRLEFVEQNIFELKNRIEYLETKKVEDERCSILVRNYYKKYIEELKPILNHFQQIKAELEAWEVMKKHLEYFPSDFYNGIPEELITMTSLIDKEDYHIIKKALEVKDEK